MSIVIDFTMDKYICKQGSDGNAYPAVRSFSETSVSYNLFS